ncbi:MAG: L-seryl-tRNA(Sec) selenium transferase [Anaerolineae bacterium]|jgi:L-seryl-tRNA(Ser) seleniumtransferase|nr:L-seryl-tRNA(Sec) selenium transferase [Chloroflexota bacterium]
MPESTDVRRVLPAIDALLRSKMGDALVREHGRSATLAALRTTLDQARQMLTEGASAPTVEALLGRARTELEARSAVTLLPVINATGIVLHTNLGRAPLSSAVLSAMMAVGQSYSNLEYDLEPGHRGSRYVHAEGLLCQLTGAEAALVVNNNAGAVLLALAALANGREVVISRGQLVEIGGGFRVPDVMAQSGAALVEVGTTNRTYLRDYASAISERTGALLRVHTSNFTIEGFTHQPAPADLAALAREHALILIDDLGSGTLLDTARYGLRHEPMVQESLAAGADVVTFSGDKLLGGPQAGLIVGRAHLLERIRQHPLARALRVDKSTLAGIQANLLHYVREEAEQAIPTWRMLALSEDVISNRAQTVINALGQAGGACTLLPGRSMVGGGSLPQQSLPTTLLALPPRNAEQLAHDLRMGDPPVIARIYEGRVVLDLRTVSEDELDCLVKRLSELL